MVDQTRCAGASAARFSSLACFHRRCSPTQKNSPEKQVASPAAKPLEDGNAD